MNIYIIGWIICGLLGTALANLYDYKTDKNGITVGAFLLSVIFAFLGPGFLFLMLLLFFDEIYFIDNVMNKTIIKRKNKKEGP